MKSISSGSASLAAAALLTFTFGASAEPIAHLELWSQKGDWVGGAQRVNLTYTPENSQTMMVNTNLNSFGQADYVTFDLGTLVSGPGNTYAELQFSTAALGQAMTRGLYTNAELAELAEAGHPGLDVRFQTRGCGTITGTFAVTQAIFEGSGTLDSFSAVFSQHCDGQTPALFGRFSYESVAPAMPTTPVPEPQTWALLCAGLAAGSVGRKVWCPT